LFIFLSIREKNTHQPIHINLYTSTILIILAFYHTITKYI